MKRDIKDRRASQVADQILLGNIQTFADIFEVIPKSVIATALGTNGNRITRLIENPQETVFKDLVKLSEYIDIPLPILSRLVVNSILVRQGKEMIEIKRIYKKKNKIEKDLTPIVPGEE